VTPDTSVVVAGFAEWHPHFQTAHEALSDDLPLGSHVALEAYSTLTRLPDPFRVSASVACEYIEDGFAHTRLTLLDAEHDGLVRKLAGSGIVGGGVYDALVALTAAHHELTLLTLDKRAERVYRRLGIDYKLL
jgi:predicted nucleic acid-binding protein